MALVPFAMWAARLPRSGEGARSAARGGLLMGLVAHGLLLHWLVPALAWTTAWAPLAFLVVVGVLAGLTALFGWVLHGGVHRAGAPVWLVLPVAWTATEWLQGHLPGPLAFPWLELAVGLTGFPELLGLAEVVGGRGVSFWLALVSGLLAWMVVERARMDRSRRAIALAVTAAVAVGPALWGTYRAETIPTVPVARVAVVGTDVPAAARDDAQAWNARMGPVLGEALERLEGEAFDLVVLPEGTVMTPEGEALLDVLAGAASRHEADVMVGVYQDGAPPRNLAALLRAGARPPELYRKRRLVPLVEWRPGDVATGPAGPRVLGDVYGPLVCWEAVFPEQARQARLAGADMLVNLSNDAWFSASGGWGRAGAHQHAAHLVLRAVEHRVGAVRSANGGPSYIVDPVGRVRGFPAAGVGPVVGVAGVQSVRGSTLFTRTGDLSGPASALAAVLLAWLGWRRRAERNATTREAAQHG